MSIIDLLKEEGKRLIGEAREWANSYDDPQAKFNYELSKPGVREFSLNECRVAATPENFRELERKFKLCSMSSDIADEFAESVIKSINDMFDYYDKPSLTESERHAIKQVIHAYFM